MARPPARTGARQQVEVEGHHLRLSNLDKVLAPEAGFTKGQVIDYYRRVAPVMLPHLACRAVTLKRYPDGVAHEHFFEKRCPSHAPEWVHTMVVPSRTRASRGGRGGDGDGTIRHCVVDDLPTLIWAANLAALELHVPMARADDPEHPSAVVLDLDPGPPAGMLDCARIALRLREVLDRLSLESVVKSSGGKGLHVYVPLNTPVTYETTASFARALAELLGRGGEVVSKMRKDLRPGKVLVDWSQNSLHKTTVAPYSLRATPIPRVSTPVSWEEVSTAFDTGTPDVLLFGPDETLDRVARLGDLFSPLLELEQSIPRP